MTSGQEMERVYSFNPGAHTGWTKFGELRRQLAKPTCTWKMVVRMECVLSATIVYGPQMVWWGTMTRVLNILINTAWL